MKVSDHPGWPEEVKTEVSFPPLERDLTVDVVIIGGGLTGILTAYLLSRSGKKVAVLEKKKIGDGATEYTTAFLTQVIDTDLKELVDIFGEEKAKLVWESGGRAIDLIEEIIAREKIDCEFKRCPAFMYATNEEDGQHLQKVYQLIKEMGFGARFFKEKKLNFKNFGIIEIKDQAKFHPLKFLKKVAKNAANKGALIFEDTEVLEIEGDNPVVVRTKKFTVKAQHVVIATYEPLGNPVELLLKNGMYTSYVLEAKIARGKLLEAIYWDIESPYHYFRVDGQKGYDRLIIGGEDHRVELKIDSEKSYKALEDYLKSILPRTKHQIIRRWSGPILETIDGLPYIGRMMRNDYHLVATGFSGNGMTYATIAAQIFCDIILGKKNEWISLYNAKRIPNATALLRKGIDYTKVLYGGAIKNFFGNY